MIKTKTYKNVSDLAIDLGLPEKRGLIATMKAKLTGEIIKAISKQELTHKEVSKLSGVSRSAITGIVNGHLQKVSIDRLIRILEALGKTVELKVKTAA